MNFIFGLGNPGAEFLHSRHNVGWMLVEFLRSKWDMPGFIHQKKLHSDISKNSQNMLIKPQTFMNRSGEAVAQVVGWHDKKAIEAGEFENLFVAHDDLDMELGSFKIKFGSGPKAHNGVNSIRRQLGTDQFWYVRIGVDSRNGDRRIPGQNYVLSSFTRDEQETLKSVFQQIEQKLFSSLA